MKPDTGIGEAGSSGIDTERGLATPGGGGGSASLEKGYGIITRAMKTGGSPAYNPWL